ncbi:uncharacterized protein LOC127244120 [Andrographis paniculata]|uniref:uncharacterized protein LOC127244120 n=1 Tax=Andrographis paniculata TaxID=175694 RepID=UPI0021E70D00|nr:uncharacterized protein LOC127244120 [Andrographis paniculata]
MILNERFWKWVGVMEPLVKVLKVVDQDKNPTLPIIYEAMDRAKMTIKTAVKDFQQYWDIIDERWYNQLHQDLHAAAYFLNPSLQYSGTCEFDSSEVRNGVKKVIIRLEPNLDIQVKTMNKINTFVNKIGEFGSALAIRAVATSLPADWWNVYGDEAPNLRKIVLKVLSQTCTSSSCERNWSTWSLIHTKLRNRLAIEKLHKLVYVHYNMRLRLDEAIDESGDGIDSQRNDDDSDIGGGGGGGADNGGDSGSYRDSRYSSDMGWTQGNENYYATQDTDHGYRPRIEAQRDFLNSLTEFSSEADASNFSDTRRYSGVHEHMQDLNIGYSYEDSSHNSSSSNKLGRQEWDQPNAYHHPYYWVYQRGSFREGYSYYDRSEDGNGFEAPRYSTRRWPEWWKFGVGFQCNNLRLWNLYLDEMHL